MKSWRDITKILANGARAKRPGPNYEQRQLQEEKRKLQLLQGGNPEEVTHKEPSRRGSRSKGGGRGRSKSQCLADLADTEAADWRGETILEHIPAEVVQLDEFRASHAPQAGDPVTADSPVESGAAPVAKEPGKPYFWSEADFSAEALAKYDQQLKAKAPSIDELREFRVNLETAVDRKRQEMESLYRKAMSKRGHPPPLPAKTEDQSPAHTPSVPVAPPSERCVIRLPILGRPQEVPPPDPARPIIGHSHMRPAGLSGSRSRKGKDRK
jgi:hypothetical protein